eukprot:6624523-Prymnesium_polylepis.1
MALMEPFFTLLSSDGAARKSRRFQLERSPCKSCGGTSTFKTFQAGTVPRPQRRASPLMLRRAGSCAAPKGSSSVSPAAPDPRPLSTEL